MSAAKALSDRQRHYDEAHHLMRLEWLNESTPAYVDGTPLEKHEVQTLKDSSEQCLQLITGHGMCVRSVDLDDTAYLAELDAFMAQRSDQSK